MEKAEKILKKYNQDHIINVIEKENNEIQEKLVNQILKLDIDQVMKLYQNTKKGIFFKEGKIESMPYLDKNKMSEEEKEKYSEESIKMIKNNEYAVVTLAGGQGTRLGHIGPKGTYKLDVDNGKYLFQILAETLERANKKYDVTIPWYIMTSEENNDATQKFLEEHNYFEYPKKNIHLFKQGKLPIVDEQGKLLLNSKKEIIEASDGNGGVFLSMKKAGIISEMKKNNIKWVFIGGVDNVLVKMVDTVFIGATIKSNVLVASKSVVKASPEEKVSVFGKKNGRPKVIEYSEIPQNMAHQVDKNGELFFGESDIISHLFNIKAIEKMSDEILMYHCAHKKASYIDDTGKEIVPDTANAYKFESYIFDAFEFFDNMLVLRGNREEDFAPIKNATGVDSPETAKKLYNNYWNKFKLKI